MRRLTMVVALMGISVPANAMYDTQSGRFLQHDPWATRVSQALSDRQSEGDYCHSKLALNRSLEKPNRLAGLRKRARVDKLYRDGMNLYAYVASMPTVHVDPYGLDIYLIRGNDSGRVSNDICHMKVCVDKSGQPPEELPYSTTDKDCWAFGKSGVGPNVPKSTWLGWPSLVWVGCVRGKIYADRNSSGWIIGQKQTTAYDDDVWYNYMKHVREGTEDVYSIRHNCRVYARWEFRDAPGDDVHVGPIP